MCAFNRSEQTKRTPPQQHQQNQEVYEVEGEVEGEENEDVYEEEVVEQTYYSPQKKKSFLGGFFTPGGSKRSRRQRKGSSSGSSTPSPLRKQLKQEDIGLYPNIDEISEELEDEYVNIEMSQLDKKLDTLIEKANAGEKWQNAADGKLNSLVGLKVTVNRIDSELIKKNIIVYGLEETKKQASDRENHVESIKVLCEKMKVTDIDWDDAFQITKWTPGKTRPLLIRFVRMREKREFMSNRKNLKGSSIKIADDETPDQRLERKIFQSAYEAEWKLDNKVRRIIRNGKMLILKDGKPIKQFEISGGQVAIKSPQLGSPMKG